MFDAAERDSKRIDAITHLMKFRATMRELRDKGDAGLLHPKFMEEVDMAITSLESRIRGG